LWPQQRNEIVRHLLDHVDLTGLSASLALAGPVMSYELDPVDLGDLAAVQAGGGLRALIVLGVS